MSVVGDLRAGLRLNLKENLSSGIQVSRYFLPNPTPPVVHLWPTGEINFHGAFAKGLVTYTFTVQVVVDWTEDGASQLMIDKFLDPSGADSVVTALESDPTLGGVSESVMVTTASGYAASLSQDNIPRLTVDWTVEVFVNAS
jgi:hypothetical protein